MSITIDTLPFQRFQELKKKYPTEMILITPQDLDRVGVMGAYSGPEEYVTEHFKAQKKIEVYRYRHNYKTMEGDHPELGVVFLANDSVLVPGLEAHVLIGHNARYIVEDVK